MLWNISTGTVLFIRKKKSVPKYGTEMSAVLARCWLSQAYGNQTSRHASLPTILAKAEARYHQRILWLCFEIFLQVFLFARKKKSVPILCTDILAVFVRYWLLLQAYVKAEARYNQVSFEIFLQKQFCLLHRKKKSIPLSGTDISAVAYGSQTS